MSKPSDLISQLKSVATEGLEQIVAATSLEVLEQLRVSLLGKKGGVSEVLKGLGGLSAEERPQVGAAANDWKRKLEEALAARKAVLEKLALEATLQAERLDVSLPSRLPHRGSLHLVTQTTQRMIEVLGRIGFDVMTGPEVETDYLNFEAVNIPADHPARDMQDTFFMGPGVVLRTHTTAVQIRAMRMQRWPLRILCPGAVYRCDNDATHLPMFHQVEGLWLDHGVKMSDLKGTLRYFARELFGPETKIRLRPSYFPFVEPGAEVDVSCLFCKGKGSVSGKTCRVCKETGWLEILGAGMVHPQLFDAAGYQASERGELTGFAFGVGVERVAMLLHGVPDLRLMVQGDMRFLRQF